MEASRKELQRARTSTGSLAADNSSFWKLAETNLGAWCHPEMHPFPPKSPEKSNLKSRKAMKSTLAGRAVSSSATKQAMAWEGDPTRALLAL